MPLYEMTPDSFRPLGEASFTDLKVRERDDLQRLLRTQIEVLGDDLYVLSEEFSDWDDSRRRIDLLAIDLDANLVVIELKRSTDGGHMELQAIRYAAMVSAMTFERAAQIHGEFLIRIGKPVEDARSGILEFLGWSEPDEESFGPDVRMVLVSEDFGKELTTAVLWLRERDIDIRCVRLRPYRDGDMTLVDVQQIIPLPEANEYQVQLREKEQVGRRKRAERYDVRQRFWEGLIAVARERKTRHANIKPGAASWLRASAGVGGWGTKRGKENCRFCGTKRGNPYPEFPRIPQHCKKRESAFQSMKMGSFWSVKVERVKGIEPSCRAWEARVLPLNYTRIRRAAFSSRCLGAAQRRFSGR